MSQKKPVKGTLKQLHLKYYNVLTHTSVLFSVTTFSPQKYCFLLLPSSTKQTLQNNRTQNNIHYSGAAIVIVRPTMCVD